MFKQKLFFFAFVVAAFGLAGRTFGQTALRSEESRRRIRDERLQRERASEGFLALPRAPRQRFYVDWGGWVDFNYTNFKALGKTRELSYEDLRFWVGASLDNVHSVYARLRTVNLNWGIGDSLPTPRDDDFIEPKIDILFYNLDIQQALGTYYGIDFPMELQINIGRQFLILGRGWLYFQRNDAVVLEGKTNTSLGPVDILAFAARSIKHDDNFDFSAPNPSKSRRFFYGGQVTYRGIENQTPYFMWLVQKDQSGHFFDDPVIKHDYDSYYLGLGIDGQVPLPENCPGTLNYYAEGVHESGDSRATNVAVTRSSTERIEAWAFNLGLDYIFDHPTTPSIGIEYAMASGDGDRGSVTNTIGGNRLGTNDKGFLSFGFKDTGYAFAPLFSNLQFLRYGASFKPLAASGKQYLRDITVRTNVYHFWKDRSEGTVSEFRVDGTSADLGSEIDLCLDWQVLSDLRLTIQYGLFFPGQSFTDTSNTGYLSVGMLYNF